MHSFSPSTQETEQAELHEFKASLIFIENSRLARSYTVRPYLTWPDCMHIDLVWCVPVRGKNKKRKNIRAWKLVQLIKYLLLDEFNHQNPFEKSGYSSERL